MSREETRQHDSAAGLLQRLVRVGVTAGAAAAAYMTFESQWIRCRETELPVRGLPAPWSGLKVLHLSDVHAGAFYTNTLSLRKAVRWAVPLRPDLVLLTGDILGDPVRSRDCLELLAQLDPPLGMFAVTGNHEYGLSKGPLARPRHTGHLWAQAGITLLCDDCVSLPARGGCSLVVCGADHLTGGYGLTPPGTTTPEEPVALDASAAATPFGPRPDRSRCRYFPMLLIHTPPAPDSPLTAFFRLVFAGHFHGGQLRIPSLGGLRPLQQENDDRLGGIYPWGSGSLVVSAGVGTSFLPFRLLTRPEATLWRLVYT